MTELNDKELASTIELMQTRFAAVQANARAMRAELTLAQIGAEEIQREVQALMVEQERRDAEAKAAPKPPVDAPVVPE